MGKATGNGKAGGRRCCARFGMALALALGIGSGLCALTAAPVLAETTRVGGWWVSDVADDKGKLSHCSMLTVYPAANGERVVLTVNLSGDGISMMSLRHTAWKPRPDWVQASSLVFDGDKESAMVVAGQSTADLIRLELRDWPTVFKRLRTAETVTISTEAGAVTLTLSDVYEAIRTLARCAKTGTVPQVEPAPFGPPPEGIDPDDLKSLLPPEGQEPAVDGKEMVDEEEVDEEAAAPVAR